MAEFAKPRLVRRIERMDGTLLWTPNRAHPGDGPARCLPDDFDAARRRDGGTGTSFAPWALKVPSRGRPATNDGADTWFVGYTPVWSPGSVWYDTAFARQRGERRQNGRAGVGALLPRWLAERGRDWDVPDGLVSVNIDLQTGALAGDTFVRARNGSWPE
jgi:hypothetical protein